MSEEYYDNEVLNTSVLVEGVVWQQIEGGQNYENDTFLSVDNDCNETQYFSMLDSCSNGSMLNDLNGISELSTYDENVCGVDVNSEPNLFTIEGSEDLFAYDVACDDDGNLQRYRYRLRLNGDGEYEGVPESIELVSLDNDVNTSDNHIVTDMDKCLVKKETVSDNDLIEQSEVLNDDSNGLHVNEDGECDNELAFVDTHDDTIDCNQITDIKAGIIEEHALNQCKVENVRVFEHFYDSAHDDTFNTSDDGVEQQIDSLQDQVHTTSNGSIRSNVNIENELVPVEPQHIFFTESHEQTELQTSLDHESDQNSSSSICNSSEGDHADESDLNESDAPEYEIVEGIHVTGDTEVLEEPLTLQPPQEEPLLPAYVLQIPQHINVPKRILKTCNINFSTGPEKENLATLPQVHLVKTNPRSVLKSSYVFVEKNENEKPEMVKVDRRLLKNKELVQARLFSNYIAQTKILHAPVRQHRLPRKQTIKPVERNDEEIIVQEMVVSSKGFVETIESDVGTCSKVELNAVQVVNLSDSDDDSRTKRNKFINKCTPTGDEIVISDSSDEENTHIQVISDSDEAPLLPVKKKRGRPPKHVTIQNKQSNSPTICGAIKTRWKCENCPKSFPSQGSLKSHMQYHNFLELKHKCTHCTETFKNNILLGKHLKTHDVQKETHRCLTCKKTFTSQIEFANHTRMHKKSSMVKATDVLKYSPKCTNKSPVKYHKLCQFCPKTFSTNDLLKAHEKTHMRFSCANCSLKFVSKLMLEGHVRSNCVKPLRTQTTSSCKGFKTPTSSIAKKALPCDSCTKKFTLYTSLYKHKILNHNLNTLDKKQIISENLSSKKVRRSAHGSIPANEKLRNAYATIRNKLEF